MDRHSACQNPDNHFDPTCNHFRSATAAHLAVFADLIYDIDADKPSLSVGDYLYRLRYISSHMADVQAAVAWTDDHIIITVRGTEPARLKDWATDFKFGLYQTAYGYGFHRGFYTGCCSIIYTIQAILGRLYEDDGPMPILITGHSAGAGIGTIMADCLLQTGHPVQALYTFGSPRVGCLRFRKSFQSRFENVFRIVNNNDLVCRVPPQFQGYVSFGVPWSHVGDLWYFDHDGRLHNGADLNWWAKFWDRIEGRVESVGDLCPDGINDHNMATYRHLCRRAADPQIDDLFETEHDDDPMSIDMDIERTR